MPQDHSSATFAPPLKKAEAALHWSADAADLALRVRAFAPRPGAFAFDGPLRLKVLEALAESVAPGDPPGTVLGIDGDALRVACGNGVLRLVTVQPEGRRPMSGADYERGRRGDGASRVLGDGA